MTIIYNQSLNKHTSDNRFLYSEIMFGVAQTFVQNLKDLMAARNIPCAVSCVSFAGQAVRVNTRQKILNDLLQIYVTKKSKSQ